VKKCLRALLFLWTLQGFAAFNLTWGIPAVNLDSNPPLGDTDVKAIIAIDPSGNAVATWGRTTAHHASEDIWAAVYNHSARVWSGAVKISGGGSASNPQVAIDAEGNAIFVWEEGFPSEIMSRSLSHAGVFEPPLSLAPTTIQSSSKAQITPQIVLENDGEALCVWLEFSSGAYQIHSAKKPNASSWQSLGPISSQSSHINFWHKSLKMNEQGNAFTVWEEADSTSTAVFGAQYLNGSWLSPLLIASNAKSPVAAIDNQDNVVIAWNQDNTIQSKRLKNGLLTQVTTISQPEYKALHPDIGVDALGNAVVVFERYNSMHKFICGSTLKGDDLNWSSPVDVSGPSAAEAIGAGYPVLSLNAIGDGVVVWKEFNGTNMLIQGAGFSLGTWSSTKTLSSLESNAGAPLPTYDIDVGVNLSGNIIAIWPEDPTGSGSQQIKTTAGVGLANIAPPPPVIDPVSIFSGIASGTQILHRFPAHGDLINILTWSAPESPVSFYNIYRNNFSSLIGTSVNPRYEDHQRPARTQETYLITCVDQNGQESCPITIVVDPK
jgi:hypothetical protein